MGGEMEEHCQRGSSINYKLQPSVIGSLYVFKCIQGLETAITHGYLKNQFFLIVWGTVKIPGPHNN